GASGDAGGAGGGEALIADGARVLGARVDEGRYRALVRGSLGSWRVYDGPMSSLYEWAGGAAAFERLIGAFYDRVEQDDRLVGMFPGGVSEEHRRNVVAWWSEVFGGPPTYTEQ